MKTHTIVQGDAVSLLERINNDSATLVYFDPPAKVVSNESERAKLLSLYLHTTCHAKRILSNTGVLIWHALPEFASDVRRTLGRVFGPQLFATEIVLKRRLRMRSGPTPVTDHTSLILYSKSGEFCYESPKRPISEQAKSMYAGSDDKGPFKLADLTSSVNRPNLQFPWYNHTPPPGRSWRYSLPKLEELHAEGRIHLAESQFPREKMYLSEYSEEEVGSVWDDIDLPSAERVAEKSTEQQSLKLMERVVGMVTRAEDLIVDPFCGTGTTVIAAEKLRRNWLGSDISLAACSQAVGRLKKEAGYDCDLVTGDEILSFPVQSTVAELVRALLPAAETIPIDIHELIVSAESKILEFKQTLSVDTRTNEKQKYMETMCLKTIAAFLNSDGGTLLIGVTDDHLPLGVEDEINTFHGGSTDKFLLHFTNLLRSNIGEEFYPLVDYAVIPVDRKPILRVYCKRSDRPCFIGQDFYVRTNPATGKLAGPEMLKYVFTRFPNLGGLTLS